MLLFSWLRNIWRSWRPDRPTARGHDPQSTVDYAGPSPGGAEAPGGSRLRVGVVSTVGNVRETNEDNYFVPGRYIPGRASPANGAAIDLFVVADGMGGQQAGEKASEMAVEIIPTQLATRLGDSDVDDERAVRGEIRESIATTNREILSLSSIEPSYANMGTTVVLALFGRQRVYVTGIGDSRAYRLRNGKLEQLTEDHSLADALGRAGTIGKDEVSTHKYKNVLYLYLGSKDVGEGPREVRVLDFRPGDRYLLATDGLTGVVPDDHLAEVLRTVDDPQGAAQTLVDRALESGSKDNVTCLVVHVV